MNTSSDHMLAATIAEVIESLEGVIDRAHRENSRLGYFPALYRKVTIEVRRGIEEGFFDDGQRMERLDVEFANRYLAALDAHRRGDTPTRSWRIAFAAADDWWPIVLQHLLLGMNAHINLDLGIAAARVSPGSRIHGLEADFKRINVILARLVADVQRELAEIWPALTLLDRIAGRSDDAVVNFSMERARDFAWATALQLASLSEGDQATRIERLDGHVAAIGRRVRHPGLLVGTVLRIVRLGERGGIGRTIDILR